MQTIRLKKTALALEELDFAPIYQPIGEPDSIYDCWASALYLRTFDHVDGCIAIHTIETRKGGVLYVHFSR